MSTHCLEPMTEEEMYAYLDIPAALASNDLAAGSAQSPVAA